MDELLEAHKVALKRVYDKSLYSYAKTFLGLSDINRRAHGDMVRVLEDDARRKLIVMPRGTFKTTIASVAFPLWLLTKNPNLRIMLDSEIFTNSKMRMREIKSHMDSRKWHELYGDWKGPVWSDNELIVKPRTKILKEPSIFASGIGASKTGVHADVIIADDLNTAKNSNTKEQIEKVYEHYKYYTSILEPGGTIVVVGTRYSNLDIFGRVIDNELDEEQRETLRQYERFG
jgi:hypothetical protein